MGWLPWALIYLAGIIALGIIGSIWQSRRQCEHLRSRIQNGVLNFDPIAGGVGTIATADIVEVIVVSDIAESIGFEIVTRHGKRILLKPKSLLYFPVLKDALQRSNPAIHSGQRENTCHQCGSDLRARRDICPQCGEPIPQLAGRI